jgi:hypothetical protein
MRVRILLVVVDVDRLGGGVLSFPVLENRGMVRGVGHA